MSLLTNMITCEQHELPGQYVLEWDATEDEGCLAQVDSPETRFVSEVFQKRLFRDSEGTYYYSDPPTNQVRSLSSEMRRYEGCQVRVQGHMRDASFEFSGVNLFIKRDGFKFWVCLDSLYRLLELVSFKAFPSKWVHDSVKVWQQVLVEQHDFPGHFMLSIGGLSVEQAMLSHDRFLPTGSCSSLALVWLLLRGSVMPSTCGSFRDERAKRKAADLVLFICKVVACRTIRLWYVARI